MPSKGSHLERRDQKGGYLDMNKKFGKLTAAAAVAGAGAAVVLAKKGGRRQKSGGEVRA